MSPLGSLECWALLPFLWGAVPQTLDLKYKKKVRTECGGYWTKHTSTDWFLLDANLAPSSWR